MEGIVVDVAMEHLEEDAVAVEDITGSKLDKSVDVQRM